MRLYCLLVILILTVHLSAQGGELEFTGGASLVKFDDVPEANTWGVSVRIQYNFSDASSGWMMHYYGPAETVSVGELSGGYVWKSSDSFYFEGGLGGAYSRIWGPAPMALVGVGYRISKDIFFDLPIMFTYGLTITPLIGISF